VALEEAPGARPAGADARTATWCEILPLVRVDDQVLYLRPAAGEPADSGSGTAPEEIEIDDVLAHGLRHFALLRTTDPAVAATLAPDWHACLASRPPSPASQLDQHPPQAAADTAPDGRRG
jgi:hypothetical protein